MSRETSLVALRYQPSQRFGYLFPTKYAESENNRYRVSFGRQRSNQAAKQDKVDPDVLLTSCGVLNLNSGHLCSRLLGVSPLGGHLSDSLC